MGMLLTSQQHAQHDTEQAGRTSGPGPFMATQTPPTLTKGRQYSARTRSSATARATTTSNRCMFQGQLWSQHGEWQPNAAYLPIRHVMACGLSSCPDHLHVGQAHGLACALNEPAALLQGVQQDHLQGGQSEALL